MDFRTSYDLLVYLVKLSDDPEQSWKLNRGQDVVDTARGEGRIAHSESDYSQMARLLWALKDDGSVTFEDYAGMQMIGGRRGHYALTYNDLIQASQITVTSHGRIAATSSRATVAINVANIDLTVLLSAVEEKVGEIAAPDEVKDEARSRLREARAALVGVGTGATGELLAAALRGVLGLP